MRTAHYCVSDANIHSFLFLFQDTFKDQNQLEYLDLSHNSMSKLQPHFFSNMNRLLWLNISHNDVSEIHGRIFARNSLLRVLHMNNNKLTRYFLFSNNLYNCLVHIPFFVFCILVKVFNQKTKKSAVLFVYFLCKNSPHFA